MKNHGATLSWTKKLLILNIWPAYIVLSPENYPMEYGLINFPM